MVIINNHTDLCKYILLKIGETFPDTVRAWQNNTGASLIKNSFIRFGIPGQADISGIVQGGVRLEIECKVGRDKQSEAQKNFEKMIAKLGGIYILSYSWEVVEERLKKHFNV